MGTTAHLVTVGGERTELDALVARLADLERRWTRFSDDSELSRLNRAAGSLTVLEPDTYRLVASAVEGWRRTGGRFDPTVAGAMRANGYDRDFASVGHRHEVHTRPAPGCGEVMLVPGSNAVRLPAGVELDFGGIGKGFAADLLAEEVVGRGGVGGACVNIGGDVRVAGVAPTDEGWIIELAITDGVGDTPLLIALADGAVCTSRIDLRTWSGPDGELHHLLDPATGAPTGTDMTAISVVAGSAAVAELVTKAAIVSGLDGAADLVEEFGAAAVAIDANGSQHRFGPIETYLR